MATKVQVIKTFSLDSKLPGHPTLIGSPEQRWLPMISKWKAKNTFFFLFYKQSFTREKSDSIAYTWRAFNNLHMTCQLPVFYSITYIMRVCWSFRWSLSIQHQISCVPSIHFLSWCEGSGVFMFFGL